MTESEADRVARDEAFELTILSCLRESKIQAELAEPDLVVSINDQRIGIACKRPQKNWQALRRMCNKGHKQILKQQTKDCINDGLIILEISKLINPGAGVFLETSNNIADDTKQAFNEQLYNSGITKRRDFRRHILSVGCYFTIMQWAPELKSFSVESNLTFIRLHKHSHSPKRYALLQRIVGMLDL